MRNQGKILAALLTLLAVSCGQEKNPYKSQYETASTSSTSGSTVNSNNSTKNPASGSAASPAAVSAAADTKTAAKPEAIAKADLTGVNLICSNPAALAKVQTEMAVLCVNGQPTQAFATALAAPYKGGANPPLVTIKSVDNNGVSEFIVLAIIEVAKPVADVFAKRALLNSGTVTAGNANITQTIVTTRAAAGGDDLGGADVKFDLNVSAGIIKVTDASIQQANSTALNADKSVIATVSALKAGDPNNTDNILSTSVTFMMQSGTSTQVISVNHQMANNRGQAATAEKTLLGLGQASMTDTYTKLSQ